MTTTAATRATRPPAPRRRSVATQARPVALMLPALLLTVVLMIVPIVTTIVRVIGDGGEIAVRVGGACRDGGLESGAVYAEPAREAPHVRRGDQAVALGGATSAQG